MAMASSALSANSAAASSTSKLFFCEQRKWMMPKRHSFKIRSSSSSDEADCNTEECAPDKEVGKVSMEWLAGEKTKVAGTFPPRTRGWTGYVEKDTAGQTNIYSVEPAVYVAENAISSGRAGSSADGAENTLAIYGGLALISIAVASSVLLQTGKTPAKIQTLEYSGPSLSYYITKFKPADVIVPVEASAPALTESVTPPSTEPESEAPAATEAATSASPPSESYDLEVGGVEAQPESFPDSSS